MLQEFTYDERAETILSRIESRLASGVSRARLANEAGIRMGYIADVLKRNTRCDDGRGRNPIETIDLLEKWLTEEDTLSSPKAAAHAPTPTYQRISKLIGVAHTKRKLIAITGDVGINPLNLAIRSHEPIKSCGKIASVID